MATPTPNQLASAKSTKTGRSTGLQVVAAQLDDRKYKKKCVELKVKVAEIELVSASFISSLFGLNVTRVLMSLLVSILAARRRTMRYISRYSRHGVISSEHAWNERKHLSL